MNYTIQVSAFKDVPNWVSFINFNKLIRRPTTPLNLFVDFGNVDEILPFHIVSLACVIEEYYIAGSRIVFRSILESNPITDYLRKIKFFEYWTSDIDRKNYNVSSDYTTYCLWQLHEEMFLPYIDHAKSYFQRNYFKGRDLLPLSKSMTEIFQNVVDHSESLITGYTFTQYYKSRNQFIIALCDFGIGIATCANRYFEKNGLSQMSEADAIEWAFIKGNTVKSRMNNGGLGLDYILTIAKALKGSVSVTSNSINLLQNSQGNLTKKELPESFLGTLIVITLDANYLNPLFPEGNLFYNDSDF